MNVHELKILPEHFQAVNEGIKTFEIRKNDRGYQLNDFLLLKEFDGKEFTGREILRQITYMTDYEQKDGYVVLALQKAPKNSTTFLTYIGIL